MPRRMAGSTWLAFAPPTSQFLLGGGGRALAVNLDDEYSPVGLGRRSSLEPLLSMSAEPQCRLLDDLRRGGLRHEP